GFLPSSCCAIPQPPISDMMTVAQPNRCIAVPPIEFEILSVAPCWLSMMGAFHFLHAPSCAKTERMKTDTGTSIIVNGRLVDGTGRPPIADAALVIENGRIAYAASVAQAPPAPAGSQRIDARGGTIMPGLIEAHYHPTYFNVAALEDLDIKYPVEYVT